MKKRALASISACFLGSASMLGLSSLENSIERDIANVFNAEGFYFQNLTAFDTCFLDTVIRNRSILALSARGEKFLNAINPAAGSYTFSGSEVDQIQHFWWNDFDNAPKTHDWLMDMHTSVPGDDDADALDKCYEHHNANDSAISRFAEENPEFKRRVLYPLMF